MSHSESENGAFPLSVISSCSKQSAGREKLAASLLWVTTGLFWGQVSMVGTLSHSPGGHVPLYHKSTAVISSYKQLQKREMKKEHNEEVVSSSNLPCFSPLKTFFLFQFWVVFRVLINLENKNNFQIISAMVNWNPSQAGLIVPGSYKIPVGAGY